MLCVTTLSRLQNIPIMWLPRIGCSWSKCKHHTFNHKNATPSGSTDFAKWHQYNIQPHFMFVLPGYHAQTTPCGFLASSSHALLQATSPSHNLSG